MSPPDCVRAILAEPVRIVVVGGTSVGKTTLVNHWTGSDAPTGLGRITETVQEHRAGSVHVVDTPSLDHSPDLFDAVRGADVLVWVLDGLRPVGHEESERVGMLLDIAGSVVGIASRADLLGENDRAAVERRLSARCPGPVALYDLRRRPPPLPPVDPRLTRRRALSRAVGERMEHLDALVGIYASWRQLVRSTPLSASQLARDAYEADLRRTAVRLGLDPPPTLPSPEPDSSGSLLRLLGGQAAAERSRTTRRARWLADGQVVLTDWLGPGRDDNTVRHERTRLQHWAEQWGDIPPLV